MTAGGFVPWIGVFDSGFGYAGNEKNKVAIPALDNGQLAWSMVAAMVALESYIKSSSSVAAATDAVAVLHLRYKAKVKQMQTSAPILFLYVCPTMNLHPLHVSYSS